MLKYIKEIENLKTFYKFLKTAISILINSYFVLIITRFLIKFVILIILFSLNWIKILFEIVKLIVSIIITFNELNNFWINEILRFYNKNAFYIYRNINKRNYFIKLKNILKFREIYKYRSEIIIIIFSTKLNIFKLFIF